MHLICTSAARFGAATRAALEGMKARSAGSGVRRQEGRKGGEVALEGMPAGRGGKWR
jgi:hypothetical protein